MMDEKDKKMMADLLQEKVISPLEYVRRRLLSGDAMMSSDWQVYDYVENSLSAIEKLYRMVR